MHMRNVVWMLFAFLTLSSNTYIKDSDVKSTPKIVETKKVLESNKSDAINKEYIDLHQIYSAQYQNFPDIKVLKVALDGFYIMKTKGHVKKDILTLIDFSTSSNSKRLWVLDLANQTVLYNSLVAHGRNSGDEFATKFSNKPESFQSSLGFYATGEIYQGKHGFSLRLDGLEKGLNDQARSRAVVIHGADYVAEKFIKQNKRLGRSLGCPALPQNLTKEIINVIKDKSCLFIYHSKAYQSTFLGKEVLT